MIQASYDDRATRNVLSCEKAKRNWKIDEIKNLADSIMNEHIDTDITGENLVSIKLVKNSYMILRYM